MDTKVIKGKLLVFIRLNIPESSFSIRFKDRRIIFAFSDPGLLQLFFYPFILKILRKSCFVLL